MKNITQNSLPEAIEQWISVDERLPEILEDGESEDVLCLGFKKSMPDTAAYVIMRWKLLEKIELLDLKGNPKQHGWSDRWWNINPDGYEIHYWKPLSSPGPINWG